MNGMSTLLSLEEELDPAQAALDLTDPGDDASRVEHLRRGLLSQVALGDGEDQAIGFCGRLDRSQSPRSTDRDWHGQAGEDHRSSHREDG